MTIGQRAGGRVRSVVILIPDGHCHHKQGVGSRVTDNQSSRLRGCRQRWFVPFSFCCLLTVVVGTWPFVVSAMGGVQGGGEVW